LWGAAAAGGALDREAVAAAERIAGLELTDAERDLMMEGLGELREDYEALRAVPLANAVPPAFHFDPEAAAGLAPPRATSPAGLEPPLRHAAPGPAARPADWSGDPEELAFEPVSVLARLVATRQVSSLELTRMYLDRLRRYDPLLQCVITLTEQRALAQAERADREIAAGRYRGPLHGIPWGAKDLMAVAGYPTTWGAAPFRDQVVPEDATVVRRLDEAGAVLVAKLAVGALAWGDVWFGGKTRNPWNPEQGSSGSSAGSACAVAAGLVGFALGTETYGSIVSPATRCGATGLRPTFGRVSRHGVMALSWTLDKVGALCRSAEDAALVLDALRGADGLDPSALDRPFPWTPGRDPRRLRVGWVPALFAEPLAEDAPDLAREQRRLDLEALEALRSLGVDLVALELPDRPVGPLSLILTAEASAAFDELTRSGRDELLVRQEANAWPNVFRQGRFIPAVEYVQANRVRTLLARDMAALFERVDLYATPTYGGSNLLLTNLTGHPMVVVPDGFRGDGTPGSLTFTGALFGEAELLAVAEAYQRATGFHRRHPDLDSPRRPPAAPG
jgi:Asp-tRNA(Asn)/Glu-tRNA(Gln) amidotransferase A subunit family amidase